MSRTRRKPARRAALYLRVSTGKQFERDLSIPDQRKQLTAWCAAHGYEAVREFAERGATATDDRRPTFQQMIREACSGESPFDTIVVHSYSRFFRDAFEQEFYLRKLRRAGVMLVSITQPVGDDADPMQGMMRKMIAIFDEYQSKETAKHVKRSMKENASQGFWNGAAPPYGYRTRAAERRGDKIKKVLEIDPVEAEVVRLIYRLYLHGDGVSGPLGVKNVANRVNGDGYRNRRGNTFGVGQIHGILTSRHYVGERQFNVFSAKTGERNPEEDVVTMRIPDIVDLAEFDEVQKRLHARSPRKAAPRETTGPTLLTGLAKCPSCGGNLTLRTGTGNHGRTEYSYYACTAATHRGATACRGYAMPRPKLDRLVSERVVEAMVTDDRVGRLLEAVSKRRRIQAEGADGRVASLRRELAEFDEGLRRLYRLVEAGEEVDDVLAERLSRLRVQRDATRASLEAAYDEIAPALPDDPEAVASARRLIAGKIREGGAFGRAYIRAVVDRIGFEEPGRVRIVAASGPKG